MTSPHCCSLGKREAWKFSSRHVTGSTIPILYNCYYEYHCYYWYCLDKSVKLIMNNFFCLFSTNTGAKVEVWITDSRPLSISTHSAARSKVVSSRLTNFPKVSFPNIIYDYWYRYTFNICIHSFLSELFSCYWQKYCSYLVDNWSNSVQF